MGVFFEVLQISDEAAGIHMVEETAGSSSFDDSPRVEGVASISEQGTTDCRKKDGTDSAAYCINESY